MVPAMNMSGLALAFAHTPLVAGTTARFRASLAGLISPYLSADKGEHVTKLLQAISCAKSAVYGQQSRLCWLLSPR